MANGQFTCASVDTCELNGPKTEEKPLESLASKAQVISRISLFFVTNILFGNGLQNLSQMCYKHCGTIG